MPNYKVGDVASLFPTPPSAHNGKNLQALFNERNSMHQARSVKEHFKNKAQNSEKNSTDAVMSISEDRFNQKSTSSYKLLNKHTKKCKRTNQSSSQEIAFTNPYSQKNTQKKRKFENIEGDFKRANKVSKKEATVIHTKTSFKGIKHMKKLDEMSVENSEPAKKQGKYKSAKRKTFNKIDEKQEEFNKSSEDLVNTKETKSKGEEDLLCTLFVGNLPLTVNRKELHKLFCSFGHLKTVRVRGAIPSKSNIPKKVAEITNKYHENVQSHKGFVVFKDRESAMKALSLNGTLLDNHHIIVDFATNAGEKKVYDDKLSVFIGNLPFDVSDETVWSAFEECGEIQAVRIIRDRNTGVGKGFGYILFQNTEFKERALALNNLEIGGRKIRIKPVENNSNQKTGSREALKSIRKNVALKRSRENKGKKSVKKLLKKGKRIHRNKQIARMLGEKFVK